VAKTVIVVKEADRALLAKLADASPLARMGALAAAGYWYDALDLLGRQIAADDPSQRWRELRADLLDQVGLQQVAAYDQTDGRSQ
jgi:alkyl sulfatase BDS1-like metallo-beta-lactamase superfamily hydrolase